jgi:hypothetical protein
MQEPVITAAGWSYDKVNLLEHFWEGCVAVRWGHAGFASFTDPISGLPLDVQQPFVSNVALVDMLSQGALQ